MGDFYNLSGEETLKKLHSRPEGLSWEEVQHKMATFGENILPKGSKITLLQRFIAQFKNVMVLVLLAAGIISAFVGETASMAVILAVVVLNALLGVIQENKAEKSLEALNNLAAPKSRVRRENQELTIESTLIVPGDIVLLEAGSTVPCDLRLLETANLKCDEAILTGESVPSAKNTAAIQQTVPLADQDNMAFSSTQVVYGRGVGAAVATGGDTEIGKIASHLEHHQDNETPLQKQLATLSTAITKGVLIIAIIISALGLWQGRPLLEMFMLAISLAVSAIPEGLPAIVTILLALGVNRMAKQNAVIRRLSAVETLGCTQIICSDKTGTLTQNKMTVVSCFANQQLNDGASKTNLPEPFLQAMALCNDVAADKNGKLLGDPTETALVAFTTNASRALLSKQMPRVAELPFDSERKMMSTIHQKDNGFVLFAKGAPDMLLNRCTGQLIQHEIVPLDDDGRQQILAAVKSLSQQALRVLAFAYRPLTELPAAAEQAEQDLIFVGLCGMIDPPRTDIKDAVAACKAAGIIPIMITGDHLDTASAIAKELGILTEGGKAITGSELSQISQEQLVERVAQYQVYARVAPDDKVRIVKAWQKKEKIVAMTGDGVNDAPALKTADIGIGMGITGTDVAKSVSAMVLTDDNFATIVKAVAQGRVLYANIQRTVHFLLSTNLGEVVFLFLGSLLSQTVLLPIHILWINLVTDTFPALALGLEQGEDDLMKRAPRAADAGFLSNGVAKSVIYQGILSGVLTLIVFFLGLIFYGQNIAMTMAFVTVGAVCLFHSFNLRHRKLSLLKTGIFGNKHLLWAIALSAVLHLSVVLWAPLRQLFALEKLNSEQWLIALIIAFLIIPLVEVVKLWQRLRLR